MKADWTATESGAMAIALAERFRDAGGRAYFVGGCVRDALLGTPVKDIDMEVYGLTLEQLQKAMSGQVEYSAAGVSFGVLKVHHYDIDIALPRTENKIGTGHRGFLVSPDPRLSYAEAAARRDFTLNAISYDPLSDSLLDPLNGIDDLRRGILRHCSDHFGEDPLRVLRAMQFCARFSFQVAEETIAICKTLSQEFLAPERLAGEWEKLLCKGTVPSRGLRFLRDCQWLQYYPELQNLIGCHQNPHWHPEGDVWEHTLQALDAVPLLRKQDRWQDLCVSLAVLCHDFGKPETTFIKEGKIVSPGHAQASVPLAERFMRRMWQENALIAQVLSLVQAHMDPVALEKASASDRAYRRLSLRTERLDLLADVAECDMRGTGIFCQDDLELIQKFRLRAEALSLSHAPPAPILQGRHLLAAGISPGPGMGEILRHAFDAQLDGIFTDLTGAMQWLKSRQTKN